MRVTVEAAPALALFMEPGPYARLVTEPLARGVGVGVEPGPGGLTAFWALAAGAQNAGRCPYSPQRFNNGSRFCLQEDYEALLTRGQVAGASPLRGFVFDVQFALGPGVEACPVYTESPPSYRDLATWVLVAAEVARAEALAREWVGRMNARGLRLPERVVWELNSTGGARRGYRMGAVVGTYEPLVTCEGADVYGSGQYRRYQHGPELDWELEPLRDLQGLRSGCILYRLATQGTAGTAYSHLVLGTNPQRSNAPLW